MAESSGDVKLFIGGLSWNTDDNSLNEAFSKYGAVTSAKVITDRETNRSKGYGFVTFGSREEAEAAVNGLNGQDLDGRTIRCDFAQERDSSDRRDNRERGGRRGGPYDRPRGGRGGFGGGRGGGRGGYGGGGYGGRGGRDRDSGRDNRDRY